MAFLNLSAINQKCDGWTPFKTKVGIGSNWQGFVGDINQNSLTMSVILSYLSQQQHQRTQLSITTFVLPEP